MVEWSANFVLSIGIVLFIVKRLLRYLRYLQQDDYHIQRFLNWLWTKQAWDRRGTGLAGAGLVGLYIGLPSFVIAFAAALGLIGIAYGEEDPRKIGKILLKMTERAKRLYRAALALNLMVIAIIGLIAWRDPFQIWVGAILLFQSIPFGLAGMCLLLGWDEKRRQAQFLQQAKQILADVSPFVIGITGSYGKTSTKDALGCLLQASLGPTFWPPKGVNTPMGITREIRQNLKKGMQYAVMEMGAYQEGSIRRLCELTPPHAAIITCVGTAHLERFGSQETIWRAKSELAQAVPMSGILVCNGDNEGARSIAKVYAKQQTFLYGFDSSKGDLDCWISNWQVTAQGTAFTFHWQGEKYEGLSRLFGQSSLANVAAAFTMACALGAQPQYVLSAISLLEPVDNRLQVVKDEQVTYVKDAYNSNPIGFASALEVMAALPGERRIVMTPGMIELGIQQKEQNQRIGQMAGRLCDVAIVVGQTNREALKQGFKEGGLSEERIILCQTRQEAFKQLHALVRNQDIVLIENDLPDLYEAREKF